MLLWVTTLATSHSVWEHCIQCNRCSFVCPHAVIRPCVLTTEESREKPEGLESIPLMGLPSYEFTITVSEVDCTGCGSCVGICPGKQGNKALEMCPIHQKEEHQEWFDYTKKLIPKYDVIEKFKITTVKGSQFLKPYYEFSGACAGCPSFA